MAIMALFEGRGFTRDMYEKLRGVVRWEADPATGAVLHVCAFDEAGHLHVTDVWESAASMEAFLNERLGPGLQAVGAPQPELRVLPLHNANIFAPADTYRA